MDNTNMTAATIENARIWWDDQDPQAAGWWGSYYEHRNATEMAVEHQIDSIEADEDESVEKLAPQVAAALDHLGRVTVTVMGGDVPRGRIVVDGGEVVEWRAL